jgi:amino acid adenylation domain-containing protein
VVTKQTAVPGQASAQSELVSRLAGLSPEQQRLLARRLREKSRSAQAEPAISRSEAFEAPLSFAQERFWFLQQWDRSPAYNDRLACRLTGPLAPEMLRRAIEEITRRHAILRTTFEPVNGRPIQRIAPPGPLALPQADLTALPETVRGAEALWRIVESTRQVFALDTAPALRILLLRLGEEDHLLAVTMHHIVTDGWSWGVFLRELAVLYTASTGHQPSPLPRLPIQYADFARWQREWLMGEVLEKQLAYWRQQLAGLPPVLELPADRSRPALQSLRGAARRLAIPAPLGVALREAGRRHGATPFMALLALFQMLLSRLTGQDDLAVGAPILGRSRPETEPLIGVFINTLVFRTRWSSDLAFSALLAAVRQSATAAYAHQDLPFEKLVEALEPERNPGHSPIVQVMLDLQGPAQASRQLGALTVTPLDIAAETTRFDLALLLEDGREGDFTGSLQYSTDLFDGTTIERFKGYLANLLASVVEAPERPLSGLPLLGAAERQQLLEWGDTAADLGQTRIHHSIAAQARRRPDAPALVHGAATLSYGELVRRAHRLARHLRALGVGPESLVGVCLERSPYLVVSLLAVLAAGGAYVPLDPAYPAERLDLVLTDCAARVLISRRAIAEGLSHLPPHLVLLDADRAAIAAQSGQPVESGPAAENLAYVIYTSGSTGRPKGVQVPHLALANFMQSMLERPGFGEQDTLLAVTTASFDIAALELFVPLVAGGRVLLASREEAADGALLGDLLSRSASSVLQATPATWRLLIEAGWQGAGGLTALCGGEALPWDLAEQLLVRAGAIWNMYGPTETTIWSAACRVLPAERAARLGGPLANTRLYVVDRLAEPVPIGVAGELLIGGLGVTRGYLGRPDLTAERYVPDPSGGLGARAYRTGDLVRYLPNGLLEFLGRVDHQVKIRGFRIELGEIEAALAADPRIRQAVVSVREVAGDRRLVAYLVAEGAAARPASAELRQRLRKSLPEYMVPASFLFLDALPLTPNGKVDRRALPAPERAASHPAAVAPRTPTEELVAGVWSAVLGRERIAPSDSFFELGGHSLLAGQVISRLREVTGIEVPLRRLFERPTLEELAHEVEAMLRNATHNPLPALTRVPRVGPLPLSFAQERLWFIDQLEPGSAAYNLPGALRLTGPLHVPFLRQALNEVVRRHEVLRSTFPARDGEPSLVFAPGLALEIPQISLAALPEMAREAELLRMARAAAGRAFDLATGPLARGLLVRLGDHEHALLLTLHHIVADAWSLQVLSDEIVQIYDSCMAGQPSPLAELPIQYVDFAAWQRQWMQGEVLEKELAYWRRHLAGLPPVLALPADRPRPPVRRHLGGSERFSVPEETSRALKTLSRGLGATLFMTSMAAFLTLLYRHSWQQDLAIGTPLAQRGSTEAEKLIGLLVNTLVLRHRLSEGLEFSALVQQVREEFLAAQAHGDVPFERLVEAVRPARSLSHAPLLQALFTFQNVPLAASRARDLTFTPFSVHPGMVQFDLSLTLVETDLGLIGALEYNADLFDRTTAHRMRDRLERLLEGIATGAERRLLELPLAGEAERHQVVLEWNEPSPVRPRGLLTRELSERWDERFPEVLAMAQEGASLRLLVLDPQLRPVPLGVAGELCIDVPGERLHRTGDRARFLGDGRLELLGRLDEQGKTAAAPRPGTVREERSPSNAEEKALVGIWSEVLGVDVGLHDDFFEQGGHSLLAARVLSRIRGTLGVTLPLRSLFEAPTIAQLAARIRRDSGSRPELRIPRAPRDRELPLSFAQQQLWVLQQMDPGSSAYNSARAFRLRGTLQVGALARALDEVAARHEVLRTTFPLRGGWPVQSISSSRELPLLLVDLTELAEDRRAAAAGSLLTAAARRPFDLARGPVARALLLRLGHREHVLQLAIHHIATDGWSEGVLYGELAALYSAYGAGLPASLPPLPIQYADFAVWQRQHLSSEVMEGHLAYWRIQLRGLAPLRLGNTALGPRDAANDSVAYPLALGEALTAALRRVGLGQGCTLFMVLLALLKVLLQQRAGRRDIAVGSPVAGRSAPETEGLIGAFVNTLVLRTDLAGDPEFGPLLAKVRETTLAAEEHQDLPFEHLVAALRDEREARSTLFSVWFVLHDTPMPSLSLPDLAVSGEPIRGGEARHDLSLTLWPERQGLSGLFTGRSALFSRAAIRALAEDFTALAQRVSAEPGVPLSALTAYLAAAEQQRGIARRQELKAAGVGRLQAARRKAGTR